MCFPHRPRSSVISFGATGATPAAPGANLLRYGSSEAILNGAPLSTRPSTFITIPFAGILKNLWVYLDLAFGAGQGVTYTVYINEVATALTLTLTGAGSGAGITFGSDVTNAVRVAAGDRVHLHCDRSAGAPGSVVQNADIQLVS